MLEICIVLIAYDEPKTFVVICRLFVKHIVMTQTPHVTLVRLML